MENKVMLSEYIAFLQGKLEEIGDIEVVKHNPYAPIGAVLPMTFSAEVKNIKVPSKREQYRKVVIISTDAHSEEKVCIL